MENGGVVLDDVWSSVKIENESGVEVDRNAVLTALRSTPDPQIAAIQSWVSEVQSGSTRRLGGIFKRDRYVTPNNIYEQFRVAADATEHDDVVSGVLESTESLAFTKMKFDHDDRDQEDVWNQMAKMWDLDSRFREMWRDLFTYSQVIVFMYWGTKNFKVRGKTETGTRRKKAFGGLQVPMGMTLLDPMKVAPIGSFMFRQERLVYLPDPLEAQGIDKVLAGEIDDPILSQMILQKYVPSESEQAQLADMGVWNYGTGVYLLNPKNVFRHTDTRPDHKKFANVRLKSVFELLDQKNNLRQNDRAHLIASTNFIVLIKKGSDRQPAHPKEIQALQGYSRTLARMPLLVGDHRLNVEIITPQNDSTMKPERYNTVDARITARLYRMFMTGNYAAGAKGDDSLKLARVVGRGLESSRHQLKRALEVHVFQAIVDANSDQLDEPADLRFSPKRIALEFDAAFSSFMIELRQMNEISRESLLTEFDFDQGNEARWREIEEELYDDIFETINPNNQGMPGDAQQNPDDSDQPGQSPRQAGRPSGGKGGGAAPGSGQGQAPRRPRSTSK